MSRLPGRHANIRPPHPAKVNNKHVKANLTNQVGNPGTNKRHVRISWDSREHEQDTHRPEGELEHVTMAHDMSYEGRGFISLH